MTDVVVLRRLDELDAIADTWNSLRIAYPLFVPDYKGLRLYLALSRKEFCVLLRKDRETITCVACFVSGSSWKPYKIGERKLFSLPFQEVKLFGSAVLGEIDQSTFERFLFILGTTFKFDILSLGEIPLDSSLYQVAHARRARLFLTGPSRKTSTRWLIKLPATFDEYLAELSSKLRQTVKRKVRRMEPGTEWKFRAFDDVDHVEPFLRDGEAISRLTYQWYVGDRLINDEATRHLYRERARHGQLRCYMVFASGQPCAFLRGELVDGIFHYETPGYDPRFAQLSPGLVLLMWAIRNLIEERKCRIFDFGTGGDSVGYKSQFGNVSIPSAELELGPWRRPYAVGLMLVQEALIIVKNILNWIVGNGELRQRMKKAIRRQSRAD